MNKSSILLTSLLSLGICVVASSAEARPARSSRSARPAAPRVEAPRARAVPVVHTALPIQVAMRGRMAVGTARRGPPVRPVVRPEPFVPNRALEQIRDLSRDWNHAIAARDRRRLEQVDRRLGQWLRAAIDQADRAERLARGRRDRQDAHDHAIAVRRLARDVHEAGSRHPFAQRNVQAKRTALYQLVQLTERGSRR